MNQVKKMRWLKAHDNIPVMSRDRDFSSWGNSSEPLYETPEEKLRILKQLRISPKDQLILRTKKDDYACPKTKIYRYSTVIIRHMQQHQRTLLANVTHHYVACTIPQRAINAALILAEAYYATYPVVSERIWSR